MPLLMIPGPIEISPRVAAACAAPPKSHMSPAIAEDFGASLERMRTVWKAAGDSQPFIVPGSGSIAMEMAAHNLLDAGDVAVVAWSGYFSDRIASMLELRGVEVRRVAAAPGSAPTADAVDAALQAHGAKALFVTHVDTSTGVRADAEAMCAVARRRGVLSVFDGVCATAGERFEMEAWGADVYLTASQKAIGLPAGLGLAVFSQRAMAARDALKTPVPLALDVRSWLPVMRGYEERKPAYFATPPTTLIPALRVSLDEILEGGVDARVALHATRAAEMRAAWAALGLTLLPGTEPLAANTLSAIRFPAGVGPELVGEIAKRDVLVAGGLLPALRTAYFRVGHMGDVLLRSDALKKTVRAVGDALVALGAEADVAAAARAIS